MSVAPNFEGVIPKPRDFTSGARDLTQIRHFPRGDPSLRLKNGSAQDDADIEREPQKRRPAGRLRTTQLLAL